MGSCAAKAMIRYDERRVKKGELVIDLSKVSMVLTSREEKNRHLKIMEPSASALYSRRKTSRANSISLVTFDIHADTSRTLSPTIYRNKPHDENPISPRS
eukprot:TRINITY_DN17043_c0_g1_i1.p2 TRINITY_DN17043_c0_g1~~TRINITY_DN17043_c0_g1_i1.p2  ORF type:complete len:100 (-),score=3.05 TRINITY_DN17043_c0_g1_i1:363-662(-)